jgi:hypothetical protein
MAYSQGQQPCVQNLIPRRRELRIQLDDAISIVRRAFLEIHEIDRDLASIRAGSPPSIAIAHSDVDNEVRDGSVD